MWDDPAIWQDAADGALSLRVCAACGEICHPPLPMCPHCQSLRWERKAANGKARLVSWLVSVHPGDASEAPRIVIVAKLDEGVNFVSNLVGAPVDGLHEGMALDLCFETVEGIVLPLFRPAERAA